MAPNSRSRAAPRLSSASPYTPTPPPSRSAPARRSGISTRGVRATSSDTTFHALPTTSSAPARSTIPAYYTLAPTIPCPFAGTLDASSEAILEFGRVHSSRNAGVQAVLDKLLRPVDTATNWPVLLRGVYLRPKGREMLEEILVLLTRTLVPEQVRENREMMARMYERKKTLAIRMCLRYDMLTAWRGEGVPSLGRPVEATDGQTDGDGNEKMNGNGKANGDVEMRDNEIKTWKRRELMPNIIPTLIAAPAGGWTTLAVRERMKHHPNALDTYMLLSDETVSRWSDQDLLVMTAQIALQWQWLRNNNEMLGEMEVFGWEELEGKADECDWIVDDARRKKGTGVVEGVE